MGWLRHLVAVMICAAPMGALAEDLALDPGDYSLLIGDWAGTFESKTTDGETAAAAQVRLTVGDGSRGEFWISQPEHSWDTGVRIEAGKVVLYFGHVDRPFTYAQAGDGARLTVAYEKEVEGQAHLDSLTLVKQSP